VRLEGLGTLIKSNYLIGNRTLDLPACSIVPQRTTLRNIYNSNLKWVYNCGIISTLSIGVACCEVLSDVCTKI
jgi:hypothetical protein